MAPRSPSALRRLRRRRRRRRHRQRRRPRRAGVQRRASARCSTRPTRRAARSRSPTPATGTRVDPGDTYYGLLVELRSASTAAALTDVQAGPGRGQQRARPATWPRASARPATTARPGPTSCAPGVKFEDGTADHVQGRQVRASCAPSTRRRSRTARPTSSDFLDLPEGYKGPYKSKGVEHRLGDRDAGRQDDRLPPEAAVRRLRLLRAAAAARCRCRRPRTPAPSTRST